MTGHIHALLAVCVEPAYLYSAAYFRDGSLEQSTKSALRARLTGQYCEYSPSRAWNSEGVMHSPAMEAAWPVDRGEEEKEKHPKCSFTQSDTIPQQLPEHDYIGWSVAMYIQGS